MVSSSEPENKRGRPTKAQAAERPPTRTRILTAAAETLLERGAHGLSMEQVAARVGITPGALYRHFEDKAHLVRATLEYVLVEYSPATSWLSGDAVVDADELPVIVTAIATTDAWPMRRFGVDVSAAAIGDAQLLAQLQALNATIADAIARGIEAGRDQGNVRPDVDAPLTARFVLVLLAGLATLDSIDPSLVGNPDWSTFVRDRISALLFA